MIVYYSGTGNSRYCAQMMADRLQDEIVDAGKMIRRGEKARLISKTPWVFVSPTYAWRLPRIFEQFIQEGCFSGSNDVYFVMTCGAQIGSVKLNLKKLCEDKEMRYRGVLQVVMPENYIALFKAPSPEQASEIVALARPVIDEGSGYVREGRDFEEHKVTFLDRIRSGPINPLFYKLIVKADGFYSTDDCVSCGHCETVCPLNNIFIQNGRPHWGQECTHCMACICSCPHEAIEYGKRTKGKYRYLCEEYRG